MMNINLFFIFILSALVALYIFFKPLDLKKPTFQETPIFELKNFTLHELNTTALTTYMKGDSTLKYSDRYEIKKFYYLDNAKKYLSNMKADFGVYKDNKISLHGNIKFIQKDGFIFETQDAVYDKDTKLLRAKGEYLLYKGEDKIKGKNLYFYNLQNKVISKDVTVTYQLQESYP